MLRPARVVHKRSGKTGTAPPVPRWRRGRESERLAHQLRERVKELTLLHCAASLLQGSRPTDQVVLTELAALFPPAWQHPDCCEARIAYGAVEASTPGWRDTPCKISRAFATSDGTRGVIEVGYPEPPDASDEPFLDEERTLVDSVSEMLVSCLERRRAEERVAQLAYYESVTGLPNRVSLEERLIDAVKAAEGSGHALALMLMNLSDFRSINNALGHRNGNALLRQVARSLRETLDESDVLANLGGDEFVILLTHLADRGGIDEAIARIEEALRRPAQVAGVPVKVEGAIGVALYPEHGLTPELLWQHGDVALQAARDGHRNHQMYSPEIDHYQPQRIALLGELPDAIERDELTLYYQPKVDLQSGRTVAVEALVRWRHPKHGLIFPDRFVVLAERTQIIHPLTHWVLRCALRQGRAWLDEGLPLQLSVNLSARNLLDPNLPAQVRSLADAAGFPLDRLTLEITETAIMTDPLRAKAALDVLHGWGVQFAMDDFGVGQSSLTYLKDLQVDEMKIDKSFVIGFGEARNAAIVRAAVELGHGLGIRITAEGVEHEDTRRALRDLGCDLGQGYLFARPLPPDALQEWLRQSCWGADGA